MSKFQAEIADMVRKVQSGTDVFSQRLHNQQAGRVFWVMATTKTNYASFVASHPSYKSGQGVTTVASVYNTITDAIAACTASQDDVIYVDGGYTQTITAAAGIAVSKIGISIVGLGQGTLRPTISFTTSTAASVTMTAANCSFKNFIFDLTGIDALVLGLSISAAGVSILDSKFITANASGQAVAAIVTTAAADNLTIERNRFVGSTDAGTTCAITLVAGDNARIVANDFIGAYSSGVGAIRSISTLNTNCTIKDNLIMNSTASATKAITLLTGSTGAIYNNRFGIGSGTAPITADAAWWGGNYSAAAVATNATLV